MLDLFSLISCGMFELYFNQFLLLFKRKDTLGLLTALGFTCDDQRNNANGKESKGIISEKGQYPVAIVIPTNEELIIARETLKLILS